MAQYLAVLYMSVLGLYAPLTTVAKPLAIAGQGRASAHFLQDFLHFISFIASYILVNTVYEHCYTVHIFNTGVFSIFPVVRTFHDSLESLHTLGCFRE
jgi:hypothetical protein